KVPESLAVMDESGKSRTFLSYKSPTEVLVAVFFSARCDADKTQWPVLRRLHERYKGWRVAFLAVSASPQETLPELLDLLKRQKLPWPAVRDEGRTAVSFLKI